MKLLFTMSVLFLLATEECVLLFRSIAIYSNSSSPSIQINMGDLNISDYFINVACEWKVQPCYVECSELTGNLSNQTTTIREQYNYSLVLDISGTTCNVTKCIPDPIISLMSEVCSQTLHVISLKRLLNIKSMCRTIFSNTTILKKYISLEKKCIDNIIRMHFDGYSKDYDLEDLTLTVVQIDTTSTVNLSCVPVSAPKVFGFDFSVDVCVPVKPFQNVTEEQSKFAVVSYNSSSQFMFGSLDIVSQVIRVEAAGRNIKDLNPNLLINFTVTTPRNRSIQCEFFDEKEYIWSRRGSHTQLDNTSNIVTCSYDHMTPFAVLLVDVKLEKSQWIAMSYITYIGCGLSSIFSAAAVVVYLVKKFPTGDSSASIHLSLSIALFILNTSFMFSELAASISIEGICVFVAVVIEYSLLCCFSWMAAEAIHLYLLLIKVFNTHIRHYMVKLSLLGWGVPAVLVAASLSVYDVKQFYGTKNVTFSDTTEEVKICWIIELPFLYGMNLTYFGCMFLFNTAVLWTVTIQICKLRSMDVKQSRLPNCKDVFTVLGLTCLLGTTWGLAFFSAGYTNLPVLYLFCICNTLQGLFMFLWVYGTIRKNRRSTPETLSPCNPHSTMDRIKDSKSFSDISQHS